MQISQKALMARFQFFVVIREAILQKMAPILDPVNFFWVLILLGRSACDSESKLPSNPLQRESDNKKAKHSGDFIFLHYKHSTL